MSAFRAERFVPERLEDLDREELHAADLDLHRSMASLAGRNPGRLLEDVVNAHLFVLEELLERDQRHEGEGFDRLDELTADLSPELARRIYGAEQLAGLAKVEYAEEDEAVNEDFAPVLPGSAEDLPAIPWESIDAHLRDFLVQTPTVYLVGSTTQGQTRNDIDLLIRGPLSPELRRAIEVRIGRMLPPAISRRVQFLDDTGGPYGPHLPLYQLRAERIQGATLVRMRQEPSSPHLILAKPEGPRPAVLQAHFRARSVHGDLRIKVGADFLVGWTIAVQRTGTIPDVETVEQARAIAREFDVDGSRWSKPLRAPAGVFAAPKQVQPVRWLEIDGVVFGEGEVGATAHEKGVMVAIARPEITQGVQKPQAHEYFVEGDDRFGGLLFFRLLPGREARDTEDVAAGRRTPRGETFWRAMLTKSLVPSVLKPRAVKTQTIPPVGYSWLPTGIRAEIPRGLRYWEADSPAEIGRVRDELVRARLVTDETVRFEGGRFRLLAHARKAFGYVIEPLQKAAADEAVPYALLWQRWKGPSAERDAPTREVFHLMLRRSATVVEDFQLEVDPTAGDATAAVRRVFRDVQADVLLAFEGPVEPGRAVAGASLNSTRATASVIRRIAGGQARLLQDTRGRIQLSIEEGPLVGQYVLAAEDASAEALWLLAPAQSLGKRHRLADLPLAGGQILRDVQIWDPTEIQDADDKGGDRAQLAPLAVFKPLKPAPRASNEFRIRELERIGEFVTPILAQGVQVEAKANGFHVVVEKDAEGRTFGFTEEFFDRKTEHVDLLAHLPGLRRELESIDGAFVLDCEFLAVGPGNVLVPRRELAAFRSAHPPDDARVRLMAFDLLYHPTARNLTQRPLRERRALLERLLHGRPQTPLGAGPRVRLMPVLGVARALKDVRAAIARALRVPGSEGAMLKSLEMTYPLGGVTDSMAKVRAVRELRALVYDRDPVKDAPGVYNLRLAVGPVDAAEAARWKETIEHGGKRYVPIGTSFNTRVEVLPGAVVREEVTEILYTPGPPQELRHFTPVVVDVHDGPPMRVAEVLELLGAGELRKAEEFDLFEERGVRLLKSERGEEERYVLGVVLEPEEEDSQGDIYDAEAIRRAAHFFMEKHARVGLMHRRIVGRPATLDRQAAILESYLAPVDFTLEGQFIRKGTWMLGIRVLDDGLWSSVKRGALTGFSIGGYGLREAIGEAA